MQVLEILLAGPYNIGLALAAVTGIYLAIRAGRTQAASPVSWATLVVAGAMGGLIGSKFIVFDLQPVGYGEKSNLGGIAFGIAVVVVLSRVLAVSALRTLDTLAVPTLVAMAIGRVGCFLAECCVGTATSLPWGVRNAGAEHAAHPVQLYEAAADVALIGVLLRVVPARHAGHRIGVAVTGYAAIRFLTEFVRDGREVQWGLNPVQWYMLGIGVAIAMWTVLRARRADASTASVAFVARNGARRSPRTVSSERKVVVGVPVAMLVLLLGAHVWFTPLETVVIAGAATALLIHVVVNTWPPLAVRRFAPSLGAAVLLQVPQGDGAPRREIVIGGAAWKGSYSRLTGSTIRSNYDSCTGETTYDRINTYEPRSSSSRTFSLGVRQSSAAGTRVTVEGQLTTGKDAAGWTSGSKGPSVAIRAFGGSAFVETDKADFGFGVTSGRHSRLGIADNGMSGTAFLRLATSKSVFVEGRLASASLYPTAGEVSYVGLGIRSSPRGARFVAGVGNATVLGVHIPLNGLELDLMMRDPNRLPDGAKGSSSVSVGLRYALSLR